ncbi:Major Facilitator Superfamily protein [Corynebacterium atrinae]|uniref:MFS transporter n=1 Tax=Corynebacterium atrinae TaxID=1336740 RepID=UPI0025B5A713|nr:MFS transporter [Corynebacterium atrinae]WJY62194.1 Major Facilitator Superfamily protein [Corynebacterium atrinae]
MAEIVASRRRVLTALMIAQIMAGLAHGVTFSMGAILAADIAGPAWGGAASTVTTIGAGLWAVPLARIVERRGRRASLSTGLALGSVGALSAMLGAQTRIFGFLLVGFFFLGAAVAMNLQSRFAAADIASDEHKGRDISLVVWSTTIGAVLGPNLFGPTETLGAALGLANFAGAYVVCIAAQWIAILVLQVMLRPQPAPVAARATSLPKVKLAEHPVVMSAIVTNAFSHFAMIAIMSMTAVHMHSHGASFTLIGLTISFHVGGMFGLAPVFGYLADTVGARQTMLLGVGMTLLSALLLVFWAGNEKIVVVALALLGLGWSATLVGSSAVVATAAPPEYKAGLQGRSDLLMNLTGALGGVVAGPVVSMLGMPAMAGMVLVLITAVTVFTAALRRRA